MMTRLLATAATMALLTLTGCSTQLSANADIVDVEGTSAVPGTGTFTAPGTWDLRYSYDCSKQRSEGVVDANSFAMTVFNADDASTAFEHPEETVHGTSGSHVLHFQRAGPYHIDVTSKCDWHIVVVDTSSSS